MVSMSPNIRYIFALWALCTEFSFCKAQTTPQKTIYTAETPPPQQAVHQNLVYRGCFAERETDVAERDMGYFAGYVAGSTDGGELAQCNNLCKDAGYAYMGLQSFIECWCSNTVGKYGPSVDDYSCDNNPNCFWSNTHTLPCGWNRMNAVYSVGDAVVPASLAYIRGLEYMGCFAGPDQEYTLAPASTAGPDHLAWCNHKCAANKYTHFIVSRPTTFFTKEKAECWCENNPSYTLLPEQGVCSSTPLSDRQKAPLGWARRDDWKLAVYRTNSGIMLYKVALLGGGECDVDVTDHYTPACAYQQECTVALNDTHTPVGVSNTCLEKGWSVEVTYRCGMERAENVEAKTAKFDSKTPLYLYCDTTPPVGEEVFSSAGFNTTLFVSIFVPVFVGVALILGVGYYCRKKRAAEKTDTNAPAVQPPAALVGRRPGRTRTNRTDATRAPSTASNSGDEEPAPVARA